MEVEFAKFQLSNNAKHDSDGYLNMFRYIKDNQLFFKICNFNFYQLIFYPNW